MTSSLDCDAVVIGGGFAGVAAARDLVRSGFEVTLLEARPRLGGRVWTDDFEEAGVGVELGGGFFTSAHQRVVMELAEAGMATRERPLPTNWTWRTGGELRVNWPVDEALRSELVRTLFELAADGDDPDAHRLSLIEWCDRRAVDPAIRDLLRAPWSITAGADPGDAAMTDLFEALRTHGGPAGIPVMLSRTPAAGFSALVERMASPIPRIELETEVSSVRVDAEGIVEVGLDKGGSRTARAAVVALPVNVLPALAIEATDPGRRVSLDALAGSSAGASLKLMIQADGVEEGSIAAGCGEGLDLLMTDRLLDDGSVLMIGFGPRSDWAGEITDEAVDRAVGAMYPDACVRAWICHDWVNDPRSMGTWLATRPGSDPPDPPRAEPGDPIVFAGSDIADHAAGWIEGALLSGASAAAQTADRLRGGG